MNLKALSAVVLLCALFCGSEARSLHHEVGALSVTVSLKSQEFLDVNAYVHSEKPELANAKAISAKVVGSDIKLYTLLYTNLVYFYDVLVEKDPARNLQPFTIRGFGKRLRTA